MTSPEFHIYGCACHGCSGEQNNMNPLTKITPPNNSFGQGSIIVIGLLTGAILGLLTEWFSK